MATRSSAPLAAPVTVLGDSQDPEARKQIKTYVHICLKSLRGHSEKMSKCICDTYVHEMYEDFLNM